MGYREHEKELQQPDELQKLGSQAVPWLEQHGKAVITGLVVVLVIWGGFALASRFNEKGEEDAASELGGALKLLSRDVNANPPATTPEGEEPPFKSEQEKDEAIIKRLSEFRLKHTGQKAAVTASLPLAQAYLRQNKPELAQSLVDEFLRGSDLSDPLRAPAIEAKGYALEAQQKYDEALTAFDQLAKENRTDFMKGMGMYHRGRMQLLKGDKDGAAKQFSDLQTAAPDTAAARMAKDRLTILAAQGVAIPKPPVVAGSPDAGL